MAPIFDIDEKLRQYLEGTASQEVRDEVQAWAASDPDHQAQLDQLVALWGRATGSAVYREIDPQADWQKVHQRLQTPDSAPSGRTINSSPAVRRRTWAIAAAILLLASLSLFFLRGPGDPEMKLAQSAEEEMTVALADGSTAILRPHSRLAYPESFPGDQRRLELQEGEVFFDVERNPQKPFIVSSGQPIVEVKGTSFTVSRDGEQTQVAVRTGKVRFYLPGDESVDVLLTPGQKAEINPQTGLLAQTTTRENEFSWTSDTLKFRDTPILEVIAALEDHFAIEITTGTQFDTSRTLTSTFVDEELEEVLQELRVILGIQYTISKDEVMLE
ncbi:MAG: FecR domain-containing protein [Bacteroidota bacterium]